MNIHRTADEQVKIKEGERNGAPRICRREYNETRPGFKFMFNTASLARARCAPV